MGIDVLPPDINESLRHFTAIPSDKANDPGAIRFGLTAIKGIGDSSVLEIIKSREEGKFESIEDFARRVPSKTLNKKTIESLAKAGALDSLAERRALVEHYDIIVDFAKSCGDVSSAQTDLFDSMSDEDATAQIEFPKADDATIQQKLQWEKETLGMYVSSHPLAGLKKYIGKKAQLIGSLTTKEVGKKITLAGIAEGVKKITTKKGDTMAIVFLEDPTGKIEITLFPRSYAEYAEILELPDTVLVVGGTLDYRGGQLQVRASAMKKASLSKMIDHAKKDGFFDEEEAKRGLSITKPSFEAEEIEIVDEEGNVVAGETVSIETDTGSDDYLGPLGKWILEGMSTEEILGVLALGADVKKEGKRGRKGKGKGERGKGKEIKEEIKKEEKDEEVTTKTKISVHTIDLPSRAPKKLLLDLKKVLETFPGKEKVQLKIGDQTIPLPITINMSTVLEKKIEEVIEQFAVSAA